jgi:hypothetical protein
MQFQQFYDQSLYFHYKMKLLRFGQNFKSSGKQELLLNQN